MIAERWRLSRAQLDEFSLASHEKAAAAQDEGRYAAQIAPGWPRPAPTPRR
jgi:acetyl-CoA acyltransferase